MNRSFNKKQQSTGSHFNNIDITFSRHAVASTTTTNKKHQKHSGSKQQVADVVTAIAAA